MCRSIRQRSTTSIKNENDDLTREQEITSLLNNASEQGMMILHPTNTATTITFSPRTRTSAASPTTTEHSTSTNYPPNDHNDEQERVNDDLKDEGGRTPTRTSSMMIPFIVSPTSIDEDNVIIILPHAVNDDGEDDERMETTTRRNDAMNNKNKDDHDEDDFPLIALRGDPHILLAQKAQVQSKNKHATAHTATTTKKDKKKRRVSIDERVHVRTTLMRSEISPQEKSAAWYSTEEYKEITESCCKQVQRLNRGEVLKDKKYCARGLEAYTRVRAKTRKLTRLLAYEALWEEEERQLLSGIRNDEALARVYRAVSSSCELWARRVALEDQKEADNIAHF